MKILDRLDCLRLELKDLKSELRHIENFNLGDIDFAGLKRLEERQLKVLDQIKSTTSSLEHLESKISSLDE